MENDMVIVGRLKDDVGFKALESAAYTGNINLEILSPHEFKYFSLLVKIYDDFKSKRIAQPDAESRKAKIYAEYEKSVEEHFSRLIDNLKWRDNVSKSEDLRQRINKSTDKAEMLTLAIECISAMTCDESFLKTYNSKLDTLQ